LEKYRLVTGPEVVSAATFKENVTTFGVCVGLALQALGKSALRTNLLPKEIVRDRIIEKKKPWAVAAAATILLGCGISLGAHAFPTMGVAPEKWSRAETAAKQVASDGSSLETAKKTAETAHAAEITKGERLVGNVEGRLLWPEMLRAVDLCLPEDDRDPLPPVDQQARLHIDNIDAQEVEDLAVWLQGVKLLTGKGEEEAAPASEEAQDTASGDDTGTDEGKDKKDELSGKGWVVQIRGHHFRNWTTAGGNQWAAFVENTLVNHLNGYQTEIFDENGNEIEFIDISAAPKKLVELPDPTLPKVPDGNTGQMVYQKKLVPIGDLGISHATLILPDQPEEVELIKPTTEGDTRTEVEKEKALRFDFVVQFAWQPKTPSERKAEQEAAKTANGNTEKGT